jgi:hypothetical protein
VKITEINGIDNSVIERQATDEELAQMQAEAATAEAQLIEREAVEAAKAQSKAAADTIFMDYEQLS